ncbi:MAG: carbohydrate ABC transporter permease [Acidimicrobiia bacterium]|nr:carbohydrate ABC transporter permease [Acidimicrobiia bacterium]
MALDTTPKGWRSWVRYTLLILMAVIILFPIYTTIIASLKPGNRVLRNPLVPDSFTLDVLRNAWTQGRLGRYLWNSAVVAFIVTTFQLITSVMSAYAFSFLRFPLKRFIFAIFMATLLVPFEVTLPKTT